MSPSTPTIAFPLEGTWLALNPPGHPRHAYDISALGPDRRLLRVPRWKAVLGRARAQDLYGWGRPISSPVSGEVAIAVDGVPDRERLNPIVDVPASMLVRPARAKGDLAALAGNHLVIAFEGVFAVLAHLQRDSVRVREGDTVAEGDPLGVVGNAGNTLAPHLHFHVMDGPDFAKANVVPFRVRSYDRWIEGRWVPMRDQPLPLRKGRIRAGEVAARAG